MNEYTQKSTLQTERELLKRLSIADLERANAYAKDLGSGLQIVRSFPQGVTIFGSASYLFYHFSHFSVTYYKDIHL